VSGDASVIPVTSKERNILSAVAPNDGRGDDNARPLEHNLNLRSEYPGSTSPRQTSEESPFLQNEHGQLNYIDPGHWQSVLDDIKEVREHLAEAQSWKASGLHVNEVQGDASFLFGLDSRANLAGILSSLPSQSKCDTLLSGYFTTPFLILAIVHPDKFRREVRCLDDSPVPLLTKV
jgi:hypothetical protein